MFRYIEKNKTIVKIILCILAITFITFGVSTFSNLVNDNYIIKLKDEKITEYEIKNILNSQDKEDYSITDIKEVYNLLLNRAYLLLGAKKMGIVIAPIAIKQTLSTIDMFKTNSIFDINLLKKYLKSTGQSENQFINNIKNDLYIKNLIDIFNNNLIISDGQINIFINSLFSQKQIQQLPILNKLFFDKIQVTEDKLKKFYQDNLQNYTSLEAAKFEYIKITPQELASTQKVNDNEIKQYFEKVKNSYPQRIIYDIVIAFPKNIQLTPTIKQKLLQKAQYLYQEILSNPQNFEILAQQYSDDKSSAINGGKLGLISKNGQLEKPIEDIAFNLKIGEISNVIESNYGFHIIKTTLAINGKDLFKEKKDIAYLIAQDKAYKKINDIKTKASEISFDNPKELDSTSEAIGIKVRQINQWITKDDATKYNIPQKVIDNLFTQDVFEQKNNSDLIDVNNNESWIIRVLNTRKKQAMPFNQIKNQVMNDYKNSKVKYLVKLEAQKIFSSLQNDKNSLHNLPWSMPENIDYQVAKYIFNNEQLNKFIEAKPNNNSPAFFLVEKDEGYIIIKVNKIIYPKNINLEDYKNLLQQNLFALQLNAFLQKQKTRFKIKTGTQKLSEIK